MIPTRIDFASHLTAATSILVSPNIGTSSTQIEKEAWTTAEELDFEALRTDQGLHILEERLNELMGFQHDSDIEKAIDDFSEKL